MHGRDRLPVQPLRQLLKAGRGVHECLVADLVVDQQRDLEFGFGDVDSEHSVHTSLLSVASCAVSLVHPSCTRKECAFDTVRPDATR